MSREIPRTWRQKVGFDGLWNTIILEATIVVSDDGHDVSWRGSVSSDRLRRPVQIIPLHAAGAAVTIDAELPDGLKVTGKVTLKAPGGQWILWTDGLSYHFPGQAPQVVGGSLLALGDAIEPVPPPAPPVPPAPPAPPSSPPPAAPLIEPAMGREGDLFPYQYLRIWPSPSPDDLALSFVTYPPVSALPGDFYQTLVGLARSGMEEAAVAYIEGQPFQGVTFAPPFVSDLRALPSPFGAYPVVLALAAQAMERSPAEVVDEIWGLVGCPCADASTLLGSSTYLAALASVWQSYFALVIELGYERPRRAELTLLIVADHLLRWLAARCGSTPSREELVALALATVVLPAGAFPLPPAGATESPPGSPFESPPGPEDLIVPYAIGELQMVRQKLVGHALGDLAQIESVMAGERRETVTRTKQIETSMTSKKSAGTTTNATRAGSTSLSNEVQSSLADTCTTATYNNFSTTYGPPASGGLPQSTVNGSWTIQRQLDAPSGGTIEPGERERFAKTIVERAAQRVANRVIETRTVSTSRESEESLTRVLDNTTGATGRHGIYHWLNEIRETQVVHYGTRLVLELFIPLPAARYLREEIGLPHAEAPPVPPAAIHVESYDDVLPACFPHLAARYPSEALTLPPDPRRAVSGWVRSGDPLSLTIPEGYAASAVSVGCVLPPGQASLSIQGLVGRTAVSLPVTTTSVKSFPMDDETGSIQVLLQTDGPYASPPTLLEPVQLSVEIAAAPTPETMARWQLKTFQAIHAAYDAQLQAYEGRAAPAGTGPEPRSSRRATERRELRAAGIDLLFRVREARTGAPDGIDVARPRYLQFFEQAFEWDEITYRFLGDKEAPRGRRRSAPEGVAGDERFLEFLNAAYATILLPVSPSEAPLVLYFLASGMLWDGRETPAFDAQVALVNELKKLPPGPFEPRPVGKPSRFAVPTAISVLEDGTGSIENLCQLVQGG